MQDSLFIKWKGELLSASINYPIHMKSEGEYPLVIICHGFIGSKVGVDRLFVKTARELIQDQFIVLRFDFAGCGESSGEYGKTGLCDLINQLQTVIDFAFSHLHRVDKNNVTLLGHSLGGATAVLTAVKERRIKNLILWASVGRPYEDIKRIVGVERVESLNPVSVIEYSGYYFEKTFFDSLIEYEPLKKAADFTGNVLILHGTGDEDIPVSYAKEYEESFRRRMTGSCKKLEIDAANHTISNAKHFSEVISITRQWIRNEMMVNA